MPHMTTGLTARDPARATQGFTMFTPLDLPRTYLLNMAGEAVHEWDIGGKSTNYGRLLPNGNLLVSIRTERSGPLRQAGGLMRELDWDGNEVWRYEDPYQHHDLRRRPDGNTLYLAWELLPEAYAARVRGGIPGSEHEMGIWGDCVREVDAGGKLVWEWRAWEHTEIERFPLHPRQLRHEYAHANTIFPLPGGDALICYRHIDLLGIIDRETGAYSWTRHDPELGGPHDAQMLDNGNMMIFANRSGLMPRGSAVLEFEPETGETVWAYRGNPTHSFDSNFISGCQRLWTGNTLICEGLWGRIFEVTPGGDIVWEYVSPHTFVRREGASHGDVNFVFRAYRYAPDGPEIRGRLDGLLG